MSVDPALAPDIRQVYQEQIAQTSQSDHEEKANRLQQKIRGLQDDELRLGRLLLMGKMSEESYDRLRDEWQEKVRQAELDLKDLERDTGRFLDYLDVALQLLVVLPQLYGRLEEKHRAALLQILAKRIIVSPDGEIIDHELHSPFVYLLTLQQGLENTGEGSRHVPSGAPCLASVFEQSKCRR